MATTRSRSLSQLAALSAKQFGLMTHAQAISAGLSRTALARLVETKVWERVRPRVFRRSAANQTEEQELVAICLWLGESTVVSHRSAARLLGLKLERKLPEVTVARAAWTDAPGLICHRSDDLDEDDKKLVRGISVTNGARTIIDLASGLDEQSLAIAVEEGWRLGISPAWVQKRLKALGKRGRRTGRLAQILEDCGTREKPLESALEVRMWRLLQTGKLPPPKGGYEFSDDHGQPGRIDLAYPEQDLAIECDGFETHGTREAFENDRVRATRLAALGWRIFPVTWRQLDEHPADVLKRLREALGFRSIKRSPTGPVNVVA